MSKLGNYLKETKAELKHVIWPSKSETFRHTAVVIVLSILTAYFLGVFDFLFSRILGNVLI